MDKHASSGSVPPKSVTASNFAHRLSEEDSWIMQILEWVSYAGIFMLIAIGTKSIYTGNQHHGYILFGFAFSLLINAAYFNQSKNEHHFRVALISIAAVLFVYLTATGGESNTGPLWFYVFPPLIFYLAGLQVGIILMTSCFILVAIIFRFPDLPFVTTRYAPDFQLRFLASFCFVTTFSYLLDHSRRRARKELVDLALQYETASKTDELSGLYNRREMMHRLEAELQRYQRYCHHFSIILMDIDHFKSINDNYGHDAGDEILKRFSKLIKSYSRQMDVVARWGGEEFLIMLPETTLVQALALAERVRSSIEQEAFYFQNTQIDVRMSAGVCSISQTENLVGLLRQADMNLYEAKSKGRNRIVPMVKSSHPSGLH